MKLIPRQKIWLVIVIAMNLALWIIPSDVVEQIARDRHTMLGRYSRTHFSWNVGVLAISLISFYVDWSTGETYKRRWFQVIAALLVLTPSLVLVDFLLRAPGAAHYVKNDVAYHRPVDAAFEVIFEDRPQAYRTYPNAPKGHPKVVCKYNTDERGFRNSTALDQHDVVVLGDSFAEGSSVSDEHVWPVRLAKESGLSVYNLGMSGYNPLHYLHSLKQYGLALEPRFVLCLVYEGNDFRSAKSDRKRLKPSVSKRFKTYLKQSPIIGAVDNLLIDTFGPINSHGPVKGSEVLDWLPLAIPAGPNANHYAFAPKQLRDLCESRDEFSRDKHWLNPRRQLREMNELCIEAGCRLVVVFAPTKAHVTLPAVAGDLPADKVRAFTALRYKKPLPEPEEFLANLLERTDARESIMREWCQREGISFSSLTAPLREAALAGDHVYYTYDQHWTPIGHEVVAEAVYKHLADDLMSADAEAAAR
ncbi:MAG: alginate O-acetyltransferase AlgX-related protein [Planctomycetota bacterium]|jgi:hypothetical protein